MSNVKINSFKQVVGQSLEVSSGLNFVSLSRGLSKKVSVSKSIVKGDSLKGWKAYKKEDLTSIRKDLGYRSTLLTKVVVASKELPMIKDKVIGKVLDISSINKSSVMTTDLPLTALAHKKDYRAKKDIGYLSCLHPLERVILEKVVMKTEDPLFVKGRILSSISGDEEKDNNVRRIVKKDNGYLISLCGAIGYLPFSECLNLISLPVVSKKSVPMTVNIVDSEEKVSVAELVESVMFNTPLSFGILDVVPNSLEGKKGVNVENFKGLGTKAYFTLPNNKSLLFDYTKINKSKLGDSSYPLVILSQKELYTKVYDRLSKLKLN